MFIYTKYTTQESKQKNNLEYIYEIAQEFLTEAKNEGECFLN